MACNYPKIYNFAPKTYILPSHLSEFVKIQPNYQVNISFFFFAVVVHTFFSEPVCFDTSNSVLNCVKIISNKIFWKKMAIRDFSQQNLKR